MAMVEQGNLTQTGSEAARLSLRRLRWVASPGALAAALTLWAAAARWGGLPPYILPAPTAVWSRFLAALADGTLARHTFATLGEVLGGLALGLAVASLLGYALARSRVIERILAPYVVASQSIPVVAVAPLLVIWFGPGPLSKILVSALIVFFPVLVNIVVGIRSVPEELYDLMRSLRATRWEVFTKLEIPAALPVLLGGLKIGATLAVIGAVVGEFVGADRGLGFLVNLGRGLYDTPLVFVAIFTLVGMALAFYASVAWLEGRLLKWRQPAEA